MNYLEPHMSAAGEFTRGFKARCDCGEWRDDAPCCLFRKGDTMEECRITRIMSAEEHTKMGDDAVAAGMYRNDQRVFLPGMAWFTPWYWDPTGERQARGEHVVCKEFGSKFLSSHYWATWGKVRAPICVVCPNGCWWDIDRPSTNGTGWEVSGELPRITCAPSIVVPGYHGFLRDGAFTHDIDGHPPWGVPYLEALKAKGDI